MDKKERLFEKFPPVSTEKWMEKITADLKGADFKKKLVWKTREGLEVMPFYRQDDLDRLHHRGFLPGDYPYVRGARVSGNTWLVRQDITVSDYQAANAKALDILMKGVTSLGFVIEDPQSISPDSISELLRGIHSESVELNFMTAGRAKELYEALESALLSARADMKKVRLCIAADPLGRFAQNGKLCIPVDQGLDYLAELVKETGMIPDTKCVEPSGTIFSNAGAGPLAELAYTLSAGNEYMASLTSRGISPETAARAIKFTFGIGPDFFPEIAKLRAARMLWAVIVKAYGPKSEEASLMHIHSVTGRWNKTLYDPHVNMLRTQTEAMSAVLGGAASITVEPFDTVFRTADEFSERIARNQQLLLMEESHLDKIADPGAGSYYIEELTSMIAREAWKLFLEVENEGGFLQALKNGTIQKKISTAADSRRGDIARRKEILLGTNQYPGFREHTAPAHDPEILFPEFVSGIDEEITPIRPSRGAEEFERLRLATERAQRRPLAFMLTIGNPAMRSARAQFSSNFFAVAGYEVRNNNGFETATEGVNAALDAKADIIVICSSDDDYAIVALDIFRMTAGRAVVVVAGNPPCMDALKAAGLEHFISVRSNVLETLQMFNRILGIN
ncbi:methylmalonyl-CoA mutase small subunit [bacterium]|nr:methylmalonyl-CoA mutase small subunit [bacterium]